MNKIISILLVGLLGFLGCSGSDNDGTSTFTGQAIPVAPFGKTHTATPTYEWTPVFGATRYQLLVEDIDKATVLEKWYTAEEGECASEDVICSVTPDVGVSGSSWKVLACAGEQCGLWSDELQYSFTVAGSATRFTDNGDGTVTDNNTHLVWSKDANPGGMKTWSDAQYYCNSLILANSVGWRLPAIMELISITDDTQLNPALPPGHPFTNVQSNLYWASDSWHPALSWSGPFWYVSMMDGLIYMGFLVEPHHAIRGAVWPVRTGN